MTPEQIKAVTDFIDASQHAHPMLLLFGGLAAWLSGFVPVIEYIRLGIRDRTHSAPLPVILYLFADDIAYTLLYDRWFHQIGHPFFIQIWWGFWLSTVLELIVIWTMIRFGRHELFPGFTLVQAIGAFVLLQIFAVIFLLWLNHELGDYFFFLTPMLCNVISAVGAMGLLMRRRSRKGQSMLQAWALVAVNTISNFALFPLMSPRFDTPYFHAFAAAVTLFSLAYVYLLWRAPRYDRATAQTAGAAVTA